MNAGAPAVGLSRDRLFQAWGDRRPEVAVILGSGWAGVAQDLVDPLDVPYGELPAFPPLAIQGHGGAVRLGRVAGSSREVMVLMGRQHAYEHGNAAAMREAVQTVAAVGCRVIVLTNAAGGIRADLQPGDLMLLSDHLNLVQRSPLVGVEGSGRFIDMAQAYDPVLRQQALKAAQQAVPALRISEGVYAWVLGPQFETPAEIRMLRTMGADAVGMSTVPEAIAARHAGLRVLGLSLVTNRAAGLSAENLSHAHTLNTAADHAVPARTALQAVLCAL